MTKKLRLVFAASVAALMIASAMYQSVLAAEWNRTFSVTGGSAQRLSVVLSNSGYSGTDLVDELTICNPAAAANTLYLGQSDVNTSNGVPLEAGDCKTARAVSTSNPINTGQTYLYVATTQSANFSVRSK
jgi:hypothetical protein